MNIRQRLETLADSSHRDFQAKLMPTVAKDTVLGIRTPLLRKLAKDIAGTSEAEAFLQRLPHDTYEENNLHAFLLETIADYDALIAALDRFLPYIDNWGTCDMLSPKLFKRRPEGLLQDIQRWIAHPHTYVARFGMNVLMKHYLDDAFSPAMLGWVAERADDEYYIRMEIAWYFATALAKQPAATWPWLIEKRLPTWIHNKTIQKACESYRISDSDKVKLRQLKK